MMKIIIYAMGQLFERYKKEIDWNNVIALADKTVELLCNNYSVPVISPESIGNMDYDFIAVFSNKLYETIRIELIGEYFIPQEKIIPWWEIVPGIDFVESECLQSCQAFCLSRRCKRVLDVGMSMMAGKYLTKDEFLPMEGTCLDGIGSDEADYNKNLYDHFYKDIKECKENYDAVILWDGLGCTDSQLLHIEKQARYILLYTHYLMKNMLVKEIMEKKLYPYGKVICLSKAEGLFWIVDTQYREIKDDLSIYIVIHKNYAIQNDFLYKPLCVGEYVNKEYLTEHIGDNIAYLNKKINECTALYWIWKNTNTKYVGLNHYRRYFYNNELASMDNYLDMTHACGFLREYDIILPVTLPMVNMTEFEQIYNTIDHGLCEKAHSIIRKKIEDNQPDYLQSFDSVMNGHNSFLCNMFVTKREILNRYCEWLFSFLIDAAEEVDVEGYDSYSQRVVGFFAERMWTVWLRKNRLKIKELPYVLVK